MRDKSINVIVSSDKMRGLLSIGASAKDYPSKKNILSALRLAGITYGIDKSLVFSISEEKKPVIEILIAEGTPRQLGDPAQLIWNVDIGGTKPKISIDGKADLKNLNHFEKVETGAILISKVQSVESTNGMTVKGDRIEAPSQIDKIVFPVGKNVSVSGDEMSLVADISGYVSVRDGLVHVDTVFHLKGDVDMKTGNIEFDGAIVIDGDVRSGFRVEASESIYINGSVEGSEIYSRNGSIFIQRGIHGKNRARILASDELKCGFIQDATASARHDITIEHYALNSQITSGGVIRLVENEGLLRGGKLVADKGIEVLEAGSQRNITTEMVLTRSEHKSNNTKLQELESQANNRRNNIAMLKRRREFLQLLKRHLNTISEKRGTELFGITNQIKTELIQLAKINRDIDLLKMKEKGKKNRYAILIHNELYRKVIFTIGYKQYINDTVRNGVSIKTKGDVLVVNPLA